MPHPSHKIITIEGPCVGGELIEKDGRGPLVSAPIRKGMGPTATSAGVFRPRNIRFYNYAEDPPREGKPRGKGYGVRFKRDVPHDAYHKQLIASGLVKAVGEPRDAPPHISKLMRMQAKDAKEKLPAAAEAMADRAKDLAAAAKALAAATPKDMKAIEDPKVAKKLEDAEKAHELARVRHLSAEREVEAYRAILADLKELEDAHKEAAK